MKQINFHQIKFFLPAMLFFPLMVTGWLVIDTVSTDYEKYDTYLPEAKETVFSIPNKKVYGEIKDDTLKKRDSFSSLYSKEEVITLIKQDSIKGIADRRQNVATERDVPATEHLKTWLRNAGSFFGDIFTKGAIKVYTENELPKDSIN